ncbi:MAG: hydrogenase maturation nickel metallochaperone HypA [Dethiobacteria bacterium]|jgi:hydrogenase nickel incorporation protein HypA/HybF
MHEIGILYKMAELAETVAAENSLKKITSITVEVGELSGILPVFLEKYYPLVIENREVLKESKLLVQVIRGQGLCDECKTLYNIMKNEGKCPQCHSRSKTVLGGREFVVKNILYEE